MRTEMNRETERRKLRCNRPGLLWRQIVLLFCAVWIWMLSVDANALAAGENLGGGGSLCNTIIQSDEGYFLYTASGEMLDNDDSYVLVINGQRLWFRAMEGGCLYCEEWYTAEHGNISTRYYYGPGGAAASGVVSVDGVLYLFAEDGRLLLQEERTIGETTWVSDEYGYASVKQISKDNTDPNNEDDDPDSTSGDPKPDPEKPSPPPQDNPSTQPLNGLVTLDSGASLYYVNGSPVTNRVIELNGHAYYFQTDGTLLAGQVLQVMDSAASHTGRIRARDDGILYKYEYYLDQTAEKVYYYGADCLEVRGLSFTPDGIQWFHDDGHMAKSEAVEYNGNSYLFGADGSLLTGISVLPAGIALCTEEGIFLGMLDTGWNDLNGNKYYVNPKTGAVVRGESVTLEGTVYTFDESGRLTDTSPAPSEATSLQKDEHSAGDKTGATDQATEPSAGSGEKKTIDTGSAEEKDPDEGWVPVNETDVQQFFRQVDPSEYQYWQQAASVTAGTGGVSSIGSSNSSSFARASSGVSASSASATTENIFSARKNSVSAGPSGKASTMSGTRSGSITGGEARPESAPTSHRDTVSTDIQDIGNAVGCMQLLCEKMRACLHALLKALSII